MPRIHTQRSRTRIHTTHRPSLVITLAALATISRAAAPSQPVGAYVSPKVLVAVHDTLVDVGLSGLRAPRVFLGVVVASPATGKPSYYHACLRGSCIAFKLIIDTFSAGHTSPARSSAAPRRRRSTLRRREPGGVTSTSHLDEDKDTTAFEDFSGCLLHDGPALHSHAQRSPYLFSHSLAFCVLSTLHEISQSNLSYVMNDWDQLTIELWDVVFGRSFFMTAIRPCFLWTGAALAKSLGACGDASACTAKTDIPLCTLQSFWSPSGRFVTSNLDQRSGPDANPVSASIHTFDPAAGYDVATFRPCSAPGVRRRSRLCRVLPGPYSRPTPPLAPTRGSWSVATSRTYTATVTYIAGSYALAAAC